MTSEKRKVRVIRQGSNVKGIPVLVGGAAPAPKDKNRARARLSKDKNGQTTIEVECACGNKIVIECELGESSSSGQT